MERLFFIYQRQKQFLRRFTEISSVNYIDSVTIDSAIGSHFFDKAATHGRAPATLCTFLAVRGLNYAHPHQINHARKTTPRL